MGFVLTAKKQKKIRPLARIRAMLTDKEFAAYLRDERINMQAAIENEVDPALDDMWSQFQDNCSDSGENPSEAMRLWYQDQIRQIRTAYRKNFIRNLQQAFKQDANDAVKYHSLFRQSEEENKQLQETVRKLQDHIAGNETLHNDQMTKLYLPCSKCGRTRIALCPHCMK